MFDQVKAAADRLRGQANRTPIHTSRTLNEIVGGQVFLKCENYQRVGAFKFRGAYNAISRLTDRRKEAGVITYSSGNHAQAVALVGRLLGIQTTVVMPNNAPRAKRAATEGYGATVVDYDPEETTREAIARSMAEKSGQTIIPPFDHPDVVAGQGTAALELFEDLSGLDMLLVPCGGGGLLSGCAVAAKGMVPDCRVVGIEPEVADDACRSFQTKTLQQVYNPPTIADGVRTHSLGKVTFPLVLEYVDDMKTITEQDIVEAVRFLFIAYETGGGALGGLGRGRPSERRRESGRPGRGDRQRR